MSGVGGQLAQEREQRGMSLEQIGEATGVSVVYLGAMERGEFEALPGSAFGKLYIRAYAAVLGFDAAPLIEAYDRERRPTAADAAGAARPAPAGSRPVAAAIARWRAARGDLIEPIDPAIEDETEELPAEAAAASVEAAAASVEAASVDDPAKAIAPAAEPEWPASWNIRPREEVLAEAEREEAAQRETAAKREAAEREAAAKREEAVKREEAEKRRAAELAEAAKREEAAKRDEAMKRDDTAKRAAAAVSNVKPEAKPVVATPEPARVAPPPEPAAVAVKPGAPAPEVSALPKPVARKMPPPPLPKSMAPPSGAKRNIVVFSILGVLGAIFLLLALRPGSGPKAPGRQAPAQGNDPPAATGGTMPPTQVAPQPQATPVPPTSAPATETSTPPAEKPAPAESAPAATAASDGSLTVTESGLGRRIVDSRLEEEADEFHEGEAASFQTRVIGGTHGEVIRHVWLYDGKVQQSITLKLGASDWRTHSTKTLYKQGPWTVEARDASGRVLAQASFTCIAR